MRSKPRLLNVVADEGPVFGQVGTVVETLDDVTLLVEFSDEGGESHAAAAIRRAKPPASRHTPVAA